MAHTVTTLYRNAQNFTNIFRILHLAEGRFKRIQCRSNAGSRVIHLMGNHADHLFIRFLFGLEDLLRQHFHQIERMMEATVHKR